MTGCNSGIAINLLPKYKPIACTITKIEDNLFVDATAKEEEISDARMTITTNEDGVINAAQKGGDIGMTPEEIERCNEIALEKAKELRKYIE